ncbi:HepT-like ribonuclease domain-containing protein [Euzebya sp.]|uniref:HepT-like ribonuclease domain-containing protein n=1 Tax=Euzebya sp. TaxID=1971409 RepID=UPI0035139AAC
MTYVEAVIAALSSVVALTDGLTADQLAADDMRLRAVERYWVLAGNAAKAHAHAAGLSAGAEPWSSLAGIRDALAHHRIDEVDIALLHHAASAEGPALLTEIASAQG